MQENQKFVRNIVLSIKDKSSSLSFSKTVLKPTESFLAKIKNTNKIIKSGSQKITNLFGKINEKNNEEFNFLDYKNFVSEKLIHYLSDIGHYKKQLKQINKTYIKYSKFRHIRRKMRPFYLSRMNYFTNFEAEPIKKKKTFSIINLIDNKHKTSEEYESEAAISQNRDSSEKITLPINTLNIFHEFRNEKRFLVNDNLHHISFQTMQNHHEMNNMSSIEMNKYKKFSKPSHTHYKRKSNLFILPRIEYGYDYKINRKSKEKLNEINYCLDRIEEKIRKNKSAQFLNRVKSIAS